MRRVFGKPDGWWWRTVCGLRGHAWYWCDDVCCFGDRRWCSRCLAPHPLNDGTHGQPRGWSTA